MDERLPKYGKRDSARANGHQKTPGGYTHDKENEVEKNNQTQSQEKATIPDFSDTDTVTVTVHIVLRSGHAMTHQVVLDVAAALRTYASREWQTSESDRVIGIEAESGTVYVVADEIAAIVVGKAE